MIGETIRSPLRRAVPNVRNAAPPEASFRILGSVTTLNPKGCAEPGFDCKEYGGWSYDQFTISTSGVQMSSRCLNQTRIEVVAWTARGGGMSGNRAAAL